MEKDPFSERTGSNGKHEDWNKGEVPDGSKNPESDPKSPLFTRRDFLKTAAAVAAGAAGTLLVQEISKEEKEQSRGGENEAEKLPGIDNVGIDRANLTELQVFARTEAYEREVCNFLLLKRPKSESAPRRIFSHWPIIEEAAKEHGVDPMIIASIIYVESYGEADARSSTGPLGIGQFTRDRATESGLNVRRKIGSSREPVYKYQGTGKNRKRIRTGYKNVDIYADDRLDPAKAIPAMARTFAKYKKIFGDQEDFAIQQYHDGGGPVLDVISAATGIKRSTGALALSTVGEIIKNKELNYPEIFFKNTPYHNPEIFKTIKRQLDNKEGDFGPTYYFRVMAAKELLNLYRKDPAEYNALFKQFQPRFGHNFSPNLMWSYFTPEEVEQLQIANLGELRAAKVEGRIVDVPFADVEALRDAKEEGRIADVLWQDFGWSPRLRPPSQIAESDVANQLEYIATEPATAGCLLYLVRELRLLQGENFTPIEVNSLIRTTKTQGILRGGNSNADTRLPTHTMGKSFDLPLQGKNEIYKRDLMFILSDLEMVGALAYIKEGSQDTIHVTPNPEYERRTQFFSKFFREVAGRKI